MIKIAINMLASIDEYGDTSKRAIIICAYLSA